MGAGSYVDNDVGGAAATGDGDVMMRFLPRWNILISLYGNKRFGIQLIGYCGYQQKKGWIFVEDLVRKG